MQSVASGLKAKDISLRGNKSFILRKLLFLYRETKVFRLLNFCFPIIKLLFFRLKNYKWLDVNILSVLKGDRIMLYGECGEALC